MSIKKLTIVNRHYPPNPNITGENAWDLVNYLMNQYQIEVAVVHIERGSDGGGNLRQAIGKTYPIKTIYEGRNKLFRYLSALLDGYNLIKKAASLNHGPIIVMTSPPLLPMWASKILSPKNIEWILWSMDLFPEGFAATGEMNSRNPVYRYFLKETYKNVPQKTIALGPGQQKELEKKYAKSIDHVILPCGVFMDQNKEESIPDWKEHPDKIYLGYCGNCGNAHSDYFLKVVMDHLDPRKHQMVLAVYGVKAEGLKAYAKDKEAVTILPSVPRKELHFIDIHLITLVNSWTHIAVPSKAISSVCSGSTIIFCGNDQSDNWQMLQKTGWLVNEKEELGEQVQNILSSLTREEIRAKKEQSRIIAQALQNQIKESYDLIASWAN